MNNRRKGCLITLAILGVLMVTGLRACGFLRGSYYWQQKLTVEVETPQGLRSASGVVTIEARVASNFHGNYYSLSPIGEAVVLELPAGEGEKPRWLFALLDGTRTGHMVLRGYGEKLVEWGVNLYAAGEEKVTWFKLMDDLEAYPPVQLKPEDYPMLVTFTDISDPKTVKRVDPADIAATFGPGYSLKSITLKITDEPDTKGRVEEVLGWFEEYQKNQYRLNGKKCVACSVNGQLDEMTGTGHFKAGEL